MSVKEKETVEQCAERIVRREVLCCVSGLVATLANGYCNVGMEAVPPGKTSDKEQLHSLCEKAYELAAPVEDWEEAASQAGWKLDHPGDKGALWWKGAPHTKVLRVNPSIGGYQTAEECCRHDDLEPYQWEVFEHWAVSAWLADKLEAAGEKVDKDFEGLNVWARTTTGQGISSDGVLQRIAAEILKA